MRYGQISIAELTVSKYIFITLYVRRNKVRTHARILEEEPHRSCLPYEGVEIFLYDLQSGMLFIDTVKISCTLKN